MTDYRIGVVGVPGKWSTESLADALGSRTGHRLVVDMGTVRADLNAMTLHAGEHNLCDCHALVIKKVSQRYSPDTIDRLELLRVAEAAGVRVFSGAENTLRLVDRLSCTVTLRNAGIPMPDTTITEDPAEALDAVKRYGTAVLKPLFSTKARGMRLLAASAGDKALRAEIAAYRRDNRVMYIQRKLDLHGRDLGMVFLGGEYLCTYARVSASGAWNTTIHSGGKYQAFEAEPALVELARRAQAPFGLDFTTVDVALTDSGPIVFEVSAFGGFRGALEGCGIDAAAAYADHVLARLDAG